MKLMYAICLVVVLSHVARTMGWNVRIGDVTYEEILRLVYLPKGTCSQERVVTFPEAQEKDVRSVRPVFASKVK